MAKQIAVSALVSSSWLAKQLSSSSGSLGHRLRLLDAGRYSAQSPFTAAPRIAGARNFDLATCSDKASDLQYALPSAKQFADYVGQELGIGNEDHVVVYDSSMFAPRVWWMFRAFGHRAVSVLDGGLADWARQGRSLKTGPLEQAFPAQQYTPAQQQPQQYISLEQLVQVLRKGQAAVLDARSPQRFLGLEPEPDPGLQGGCAVGSKNLFFRELYDQATGRMLPLEQLQQLFASRGVDPKGQLVTTCGHGITACHLALAATVLGNEQVRVFDGSWQEFALRGPPDLKSADRQA